MFMTVCSRYVQWYVQSRFLVVCLRVKMSLDEDDDDVSHFVSALLVQLFISDVLSVRQQTLLIRAAHPSSETLSPSASEQ